MTHSLPGAEQAIVGRLVVRQDELDTALVQVRTEVTRLTRATSALTDTIRKLPTSSGATTDATAGEDAGQRDWLSVTDPALAQEWLLDLTAWWDRIGTVLVYPPHPCWPWHPRAVVAALALQAHYSEAYAGPKALPVSDLLTRWVPTLGRHVVPKTSDCSAHEHYPDGHYHDGQGWRAHPDLLPDYAHWWATDRTGTPPGLTRRP